MFTLFNLLLSTRAVTFYTLFTCIVWKLPDQHGGTILADKQNYCEVLRTYATGTYIVIVEEHKLIINITSNPV